MLRRSACLGLAVAAALAAARGVRADSKDLSLSAPIMADDQAAAPAAAPAPAPPSKPMMAELENVGVGKEMEAENFTISGYIEGSWTYNFDRPGNHINVGRSFDFEDEDKTLNQVDIAFDRSVDASKGKFDIGFHVEWLYGGDARLIHSNGLNFYGPVNANDVNTTTGTVQDGPDQQFDLLQAYVVFAIPVGSGLTVDAGKFVTPLGYETINPTTNPLYSHSYLFNFAIPLTNTGVTGTYNFTSNLSLMLGMTRGWEQSSNDNNGSPDGIGELTYKVNDKLTLIINAICGPEDNNDTSHYRTVIDTIAKYQLGDNTLIAVNADYGYGSRENGPGNLGFDGDARSGDWWGADIYVSQKIDSHFTINVRGEYFNDDDGCRGLDTTVYEATAGVSITPFPSNQWLSGLEFRPEVRYDHANNDIFDNAHNRNQYTVAGDLIYSF